MHTLTHNFSLQQAKRFLACWDCQNRLFRTFAKFYVSKMTYFHAASEAPSQRHMKGYASESASFSFGSANVQAENVTQCCLEKLCVRTTERIAAVNCLPERFQANREKLYASEMRSYIRQTTQGHIGFIHDSGKARMREACRLIGDGLCDLWTRMTDVHRAITASKIDIAVPFNILNDSSLSPGGKDLCGIIDATCHVLMALSQ